MPRNQGNWKFEGGGKIEVGIDLVRFEFEPNLVRFELDLDLVRINLDSDPGPKSSQN